MQPETGAGAGLSPNQTAGHSASISLRGCLYERALPRLRQASSFSSCFFGGQVVHEGHGRVSVLDILADSCMRKLSCGSPVTSWLCSRKLPNYRLIYDGLCSLSPLPPFPPSSTCLEPCAALCWVHGVNFYNSTILLFLRRKCYTS